MTRRLSSVEIDEQNISDVKELAVFLRRREGSALKAWLRHFDTNNDQRVTVYEFRSGMLALGYLGDADALFHTLDTDHSGELTLEEICRVEAAVWRQFRFWCADAFSSPEDALKRLGAEGEGRAGGEGCVTQERFREGLAAAGWTGCFEDLLFASLDQENKEILGVESFKWLEIEKRRQRRKRLAKQRATQEGRRRQHTADAGKAMLEEFKQFLVKKYGGLVRAWRRVISPSNDQMVVQRAQFMRACADMGWHAKSRALWECLDKDGSGIVALDELDARSAETLAHFSAFVRETFSTAAHAFRCLDRDGSGTVKREEFVAAVKRHGFRQPARALFHGLDRHGNKAIAVEDLLFLDRWQPPAYLTAPSNAAAVEAFRAALLQGYSHYLKAWRQLLDKDSSNQCNWDEFRAACQELGYDGDVPGAWRALDKDLSGFISLREIDEAASDTLLGFRRWADAEFGGAKSAFGVFDVNRSGELAYREFRHGCRIYGFQGNAKLLFDALDCGRFGVLSLSEISFLDLWELPGDAEEAPGPGHGVPADADAAARWRTALLATRWVIGRQGQEKKAQSLANHRLRNKIRAFDRRYTRRGRPGADALGRDDDESMEVEPAPAMECSGSSFRRSSVASSVQDAGGEDEDVELMYRVVRCSSQSDAHPAGDLVRPGGCWESAGEGGVGIFEEFVVLELCGQNPDCVNAVSLALPGTKVAPRHCQVHYSTGSADGPWKKAWGFDIPSSELTRHEGRCDHRPHPRVVGFKESLRAACDSVEAAWSRILDPDGRGRLLFEEFAGACARLRAAEGGDAPAWAEDLDALFELLADESREVTLEELRREPVRPEAAWWRLIFDSAWDRGPHIRLMGPLRLSTTVRQDAARIASMRNAFGRSNKDGPAARKRESHSHITAFEINTLELDAETLRLRELAKKYELPILALEDIHKLFRHVDSNGSGVIEQAEFQTLLLQLYGATSPSDVPASRIRFYWQQANPDRSAEIDFEEFIVWFTRYAADINPRYAQSSKASALATTGPSKSRVLSDGSV